MIIKLVIYTNYPGQQITHSTTKNNKKARKMQKKIKDWHLGASGKGAPFSEAPSTQHPKVGEFFQWQENGS